MTKEKTYIFTREVRRWGVEAGDYYNPQRHTIIGGTEKLLVDGVIEEEKSEEHDIWCECTECKDARDTQASDDYDARTCHQQ